jgi:uracil-DNA glycosylase family 4
MSWDSLEFVCPECGTDECVPASGNKKSSFLIVGAYPGHEEIKRGKPFVGGTGTVLQSELRKVGLALNQFRVANLWIHEPNKIDRCYSYSKQKVIQEAKGKKLILLIGKETVKEFCDEDVSAVNGLMLSSPYLSAPVLAMIQPTSVFHQSVGEVRFGVQRFAEEVEKLDG